MSGQGSGPAASARRTRTFAPTATPAPASALPATVLGDGSPVVFCHGFALSALTYRPTLEQLAAHGTTVVAPDLFAGTGRWTYEDHDWVFQHPGLFEAVVESLRLRAFQPGMPDRRTSAAPPRRRASNGSGGPPSSSRRGAGALR